MTSPRSLSRAPELSAAPVSPVTALPDPVRVSDLYLHWLEVPGGHDLSSLLDWATE